MALSAEQIRVSMADPEALKRWLVESGRKYILMHAGDLVDALAWPGDESGDKVSVTDLQNVIEQYRDYRRGIPTGRTETQADAEGNPVSIPVMKGEVMEAEEKLELFIQLKEELSSLGLLP